MKGLQEALSKKDNSNTGVLSSEEFIRCLSESEMKFAKDEVDRLIKEITEKENYSNVNYKEFLKHSYLYQLYKNHAQL